MTTDREFIDAAAKGLEIQAEPFKDLALGLGMSEGEVIGRISRLIDEGKVRRFAASVRHQPLGYAHNAMVIARVNGEDVEDVGEAGAGIEAVSHCYQRAHPDGDPWCLYMMVHGKDARIIQQAVKRIRNIPGVREIEVCRSIEELKKTSLSGVSTRL
ncbi:MAG: Lrp/AsnC family transcriptional regulator [Deltaproteobacteria bacterium]|nr:Lrp/AsnC family transcriptional regulator [Deltaproteobacteria bacterium]